MIEQEKYVNPIRVSFWFDKDFRSIFTIADSREIISQYLKDQRISSWNWSVQIKCECSYILGNDPHFYRLINWQIVPLNITRTSDQTKNCGVPLQAVGRIKQLLHRCWERSKSVDRYWTVHGIYDGQYIWYVHMKI